MGHGLSVYHCYDRVEEIPDFEGGLHQYFVNLDCDGESQIRSLLDDFNEADETIINNPVLAYIVSQQKNLEEGTNLLHKIFKVFDNSNNRKDEQYE